MCWNVESSNYTYHQYVNGLEPEFYNKTLVKLNLSDGSYYQCNFPPGGLLFPALKTISLSLFLVSFVAFKPSGLYDCLLTSPMLEEVNICDQDPLRPLLYSGWGKTGLGFIHPENIRSHDIKDHSCFVIKTPNLVYLDYSSYVAQS